MFTLPVLERATPHLSSIRNPSVHSTTPLPPVDEDEKDEKSLSLTRKKIFGWSVKKDTSPPPSIPSTKSSREQLRSTPSPKNAAKKPSREFKDFLGIKQQNQKFLAEKVLDQFKNITKPIQQLNSQPVAGSSGGSSGAVGTLPVKISGSKFPMPSVNSEYESESDFSMNENSVNEYMDSITNSSPYSSPDVVIVSRPSDKKSYESILREETTILPTMEKNVPRRIVSLEEFGKSNNVTRIKSTQSNGSSVLPTPPNDTVIPKTPPQFATTTTMTGNSNMQNSQYQNGGYNPYPPHTTSQESFFFDKWNVNIPQRSTSLGRNTSLSSIQNGYKDEKESPTPPVPQVPDHLLQQLSQVRHTRSNTNLQSEQSQQYNSKDRMNGHESSEKKVSSLDRDVSSNKFSSLDRGRFDSNGRKKDSMERGKRMQSLDRLKKAVERTFFEPDPVRDTSPTGMSRQDSRDGKRGLASVWNGWKRKDDVPQNPHTAVESWMPPKSRNPSMPNLKEREKSKGGGKNGTFYMDVAGTTTQNGKGGKGTLSLGRTRERSDIQDDFDEMEKKRGMGKSTFGTLSLGRSRGKSRGENETRDVQEFEEPEQYVSASINANSLSRNGRESRESVTRGNAHSLSRNGRESRESLNKKELRSNRSSERLDGKRREFEGLPMLTTEFGLDFKDMLHQPEIGTEEIEEEEQNKLKPNGLLKRFGGFEDLVAARPAREELIGKNILRDDKVSGKLQNIQDQLKRQQLENVLKNKLEKRPVQEVLLEQHILKASLDEADKQQEKKV
ncbi:hypothetical protein HK098_001095 [Nowakowskiella sp. JEL0407]|nr:hypothetical protein HK098_001095 [Nowakowskiella sp. JEL0407]